MALSHLTIEGEGGAHAAGGRSGPRRVGPVLAAAGRARRDALRRRESRRRTSSRSMFKISLQVALISQYYLEFGLSGSVEVWKLVYKMRPNY